MRKLKRKIKEEAEKVSETLINLMFYFKNYMETGNTKLLILLLLLVLNTSGSTLVDNSNNIGVSFSAQLSEKTKSDMLTYSIKARAHAQLINEVDNYIDSMAPDNRLTPQVLVDVCDRYELNIIFVLSQALLESHYGTKGVAARTNSIFNVGTYDDGQILYTYNHPDESIEPYAKLLVKRYLVDKEIVHLVKDKGYTNVNGHRFASSKIYEASLRKLMIKIDMETSINMLQSIVNMDDKTLLAFFGPTEELNDFEHLYTMK